MEANDRFCGYQRQVIPTNHIVIPKRTYHSFRVSLIQRENNEGVHSTGMVGQESIEYTYLATINNRTKGATNNKTHNTVLRKYSASTV